MKKNLFLAGAAALVLASCVNEQLVGGGNSFSSIYGEDAISVRTFVGNSTKAGVAGIDSLQTNGFLVYAEHDQDGTVGAKEATFPAANWNTMNKKYVTWDNVETFWTYSPIEYWPFGGTIDFYAYSIPALGGIATPKATETNSAYDGDVSMAIDGAVTFDTKVLLDDQFDLLAGAALDRTKESSYATNGVSFNFQHVLSRIGFRAKMQDDFDMDNYKIVVNSVEVFYNTAGATTPIIKKADFQIEETAVSVTDASVVATIRESLWGEPATNGVAFVAGDGTCYVYDINTSAAGGAGMNAMDPATGVVDYKRAASGTELLSAGYTFEIGTTGDGIKTLGIDDVTLVNHDTRVALTASDRYMMVIPQTYKGSTGSTDPNTGVYTDDMTASLYAQVIFTAVKTGDNYDAAVANGTWKTMTYVKNVALPLVKQAADSSLPNTVPDGFNPGKTYTFEMELGLDAIVFSTQIGVEEWAPGTGDGSVPGEDGYHTEDDQVDDDFNAGDPVIVEKLKNGMTGVSAVTGTADGQIEVSWDLYDVAVDEAVVGIRVEYFATVTSGSVNDVVKVIELPASATEVTLTDLLMPGKYGYGVSYTVSVMAIGAPGQFGYSDATTVTGVTAYETPAI